MSSTSESTEGPVYPFNHIPSFAAGTTFVVLFSLVTGLHIGQALHRRMRWLYPTVVTGGVGEILGWVGRLWGNKEPTSMNPHLMQITTTIISPTFILAANFVIVMRIIIKLGPQYSRLRPRLYALVFCSGDVVSLIIQSIGGVVASLAKDMVAVNKGGHIALGGIALQLCGIAIYMVTTSEFLIRYYLNKPFCFRENEFVGTSPTLNSKTSQMIFGVYFSSLCMFIRSIYRTIEFTGGWSGSVISNESLFVGFDGFMIFLALAALNVFHPGRLLTEDVGLMKLRSRSLADMEMFTLQKTYR